MNIFTAHSPGEPGPVNLSDIGVLRIGSNGVVISNTSLVSKAPVCSVGPCVPCASYRASTINNFSSRILGYGLRIGVPRRFGRVLNRSLSIIAGVLDNSPQPRCRGSGGHVCTFRFSGCRVRFGMGNLSLAITRVAGTNRGVMWGDGWGNTWSLYCAGKG